MPIYAYACAACGFQQDVMQKLQDQPLTQCPQCSKLTFAKQVTAAGFQLKGSGYYVTDFKGSPKPPESKSDAVPTPTPVTAPTSPAASGKTT